MPTPDQFARMAQRCLDQMVSDTCRVAQGRQPVAAGGVPPTAVFVAGVGAIDARAYDELRRSGEAMCGVALQACRRDADSPACGVARQLWGGPTDSPGTQAARGASSAPR